MFEFDKALYEMKIQKFSTEDEQMRMALLTKQFKKKFDQTKTMKQLRTRREFIKPSVLNRAMMKKAVYKNGLNLKAE